MRARRNGMVRVHRLVGPAALSACALVVSGLIALWATAMWGGEDPAEAPSPAAEPADVGLRGILPDRVPENLEPEEFAVLDGNWADWSANVARLVVTLYEDKDLDLAAQKELVATLRAKVNVMERALGDDRYRPLFEPLVTMHGRLARRVDMAEAVLDTLALTPEKIRRTRLESAGTNVTEALDDLQSHLEGIRGGSAWLPYVRAEEIREAVQAPAEVDAARRVFEAVQRRLGKRDQLGPARREFLSAEPFVSLERAIGAYLERADEPVPPLKKEPLREELAQLIAALEEYERSGTRAAGKTVHASLAAVDELTPDRGRRIRQVVEHHYMNYNFRLVASEEVLSRYVAETHTETDDVAEQVMEAWVTGTQTTSATTGVDLKPSDKGVRFDVTLRGTVRSDTRGQTSRATIYSRGNHRFVARRAVFFNGEEFRLGEHGVISVNANNTVTGATTTYEGGLFAGVARDRAVSEARSRRYRTERIASEKIRERVLPRFDKEVEEQFADADKEVDEKLFARLREAGLEPVDRKLRTTDELMKWSSRVMQGDELGGDAVTRSPRPEQGLVLQVHESLLNNVFDRIDIAGRTMTEEQFRNEVESYFDILLGTDDEESAPESTEDADSKRSGQKDGAAEGELFVFDESDPVRFRIEQGEVIMILRTGFKQPEKDDIPTQQISVPLTIHLQGDQVVVKRGSVGVAPVKPPESRFKQITRAAEMRERIGKAISDRTLERTIELSRGDDREPVVLRMTKVSALNGWLKVTAE